MDKKEESCMFTDAMLDVPAPVLICPACGGRSISSSRDEEGCHAECECGFEAIIPSTSIFGDDLRALERVFRGRYDMQPHVDLPGITVHTPNESIDAQQRMAAAVEAQAQEAIESAKAHEARQQAAEERREVDEEREAELHPLRVAELRSSVEWRTASMNCGRAQTVALNRIADALEKMRHADDQE